MSTSYDLIRVTLRGGEKQLASHDSSANQLGYLRQQQCCHVSIVVHIFKQSMRCTNGDIMVRCARMPRQQHFVFRKKTNTTHPRSYNDFIVCFAKFFFSVNDSKIKGTRLGMSPSLGRVCHN